MEPEPPDQDAAAAAETLLHGFQADAAAAAAQGVEQGGGEPAGVGSLPQQQQGQQVPAPPDQPPAHAALAAPTLYLPPGLSAAPTQSTHSQSRSQQSRRSRRSGAGAMAGSGGAGKAAAAGPSSFVAPRGRAAKAAQGDGTLHPVLRLGWQPLCTVVCNGLTGDFLGGHGLDLYIRCTAPSYADLPLIDVNLGGCIMTCSQFERAAGRELSKKWKESIHVVGEGSGSMATLISWMKRRAGQDFGEQVVGKQIWVCWCADYEFYQGTVTAFSKDTGKHTIQYSESHSEELHLPVELLSFDPVKPRAAPTYPPAVAALAAAAAAQPPQPVLAHAGSGIQRAGGLPQQQDAGPGGGPGRPTFSFQQPAATEEELSLPNPLWHQGSGISVTSSFQDGDASLPAAGSLKEALRHAAQEALRHLSAAAHKEGRGGSLASPGPTPTHAGGAAAAALAHAAATSPASQPVAEAAAAHHPPLATTPTAAAADGSRPPLPPPPPPQQQQQQEEGAGERQPPVGGDEGQDAGMSRPLEPTVGSKRPLLHAAHEEHDALHHEISLTIPSAVAAEAASAPLGPKGPKRLRTGLVVGGGTGSAFQPVQLQPFSPRQQQQQQQQQQAPQQQPPQLLAAPPQPPPQQQPQQPEVMQRPAKGAVQPTAASAFAGRPLNLPPGVQLLAGQHGMVLQQPPHMPAGMARAEGPQPIPVSPQLQALGAAPMFERRLPVQQPPLRRRQQQQRQVYSDGPPLPPLAAAVPAAAALSCGSPPLPRHMGLQTSGLNREGSGMASALARERPAPFPQPTAASRQPPAASPALAAMSPATAAAAAALLAVSPMHPPGLRMALPAQPPGAALPAGPPVAAQAQPPPLPQQAQQLPQHAQQQAQQQAQQAQQPSSSMPSAADSLIQPPKAGFAEQDSLAMAGWMHMAALQLEPLLGRLAARRAQSGARPSPSSGNSSGSRGSIEKGRGPPGSPPSSPPQSASPPPAAPGGAGRGGGAAAAPVPSPCARFQARVALAARDGTLRGIYEAMLFRYKFFAHDPEQLPTKLCDLMLAVVQEAGAQAQPTATAPSARALHRPPAAQPAAQQQQQQPAAGAALGAPAEPQPA